MHGFPEPRRWTLDEIKAEAEISKQIYAERRPGEGREAYRVAYRDANDEVTRLFAVSDDLQALGGVLADHPELLWAARYLDAPFISDDDLETVSGQPKTRMTAEAMEARMRVIAESIDYDRFPWLTAARPPTDAERDTAIRITAAVLASQRASTVLRNMWARRQERAVAVILDANGYQETGRRTINTMLDLPTGQFCPESTVFGEKADVPVGLHNGRYLLIECKVSGSAINGYKRLNRDTISKRETWAGAFGGQAYTIAVLGGVFRPSNVLAAQTRGVFIFWEHNLEPLAEYLATIH
jgi:hypothetical protein